MDNFDPNAKAGLNAGIFGLTFQEDDARIVYLPVPWEVTTSYGGGTSLAPSAILKASHQIDLFDIELGDFWQQGLHLLPQSQDVINLNAKTKPLAQKIILEDFSDGTEKNKLLQQINSAGVILNNYVEKEISRLLKKNKIPAVIGGDHSVPYGAWRAIANKYTEFGILHFDAHSDTRCAYEDFKWSHASVMYNALENIAEIKKLVQVGIRDLCREEYEYVHEAQKNRVDVFFDVKLQAEKLQGVAWANLIKPMIAALPRNVWISLDIDGLDPVFCPNTGTPVPGGLNFSEVVYLIAMVARSGRKIIGFDLNEVVPDVLGKNEWDANVAARLLYKMSGWALSSNLI